MLELNFFFRRCCFGGKAAGTYYEYLGYYELASGGRKRYPILLYFGRIELVFYYRSYQQNAVTSGLGGSNALLKIFSLPVAEGEMNQQRLTKKLKDYLRNPFWRDPAWKRNPGAEEDVELPLRVDLDFVRGGYFPLYGDIDRCLKILERENDGDKNVVYFTPTCESLCKRSSNAGNINAGNMTANECEWRIIENEEVLSDAVDFRLLLLALVFELEQATTFEGKNFFALQPVLQNNRLLDALISKCRYLNELQKCSNKECKPGVKLPKPFRNAEKEWLNICTLSDWGCVFDPPVPRFFDDVESEVDKIVFSPCLGSEKSSRKEVLALDKEDVALRDHVARFFLCHYDIVRAWRITFPSWALLRFISCLFVGLAIYILWLKKLWLKSDRVNVYCTCLVLLGLVTFVILGIIKACKTSRDCKNTRARVWKSIVANLDIGTFIVFLFLIPFGDMIVCSAFCCEAGFFSYVAPLFFVVYVIFCFRRYRLNLFRLLLPRLFLGIMVGWSTFIATEELWKSALVSSGISITILSMIIMLLLFCYVFTDISNKLPFLGGRQIFVRSLVLLGFAMLLSLIQGVYVVQFHADSMLSNSGFITLDNKLIFEVDENDRDKIDSMPASVNNISFGELVREWDIEPHELKIHWQDRETGKELSLKVKRRDNWKYRFLKLPGCFSWWRDGVYFVWSIVLSQFILSILAGIVLQLLWEDRPITEPL